MPLLLAAALVILLPVLAGAAAVLALLLIGDTRSLLSVGLGAAGLVLAALLVPLASTGLRACAARHASQDLLGEAERLGADLPVYALWIPGETPMVRVPPDASAHLHLATAAAVAAFSPPDIPASWWRLSRRVLVAHPRGREARHGILRLPDAPRLVRVIPRPDGTSLLLDGP